MDVRAPLSHLSFVELKSRDFPGLERSDYGDALTIHGPRQHLTASGLIPSGTLFPDEAKAKRGIRWRDASNRRYVLSKGWRPADEFTLKVHPTPDEKRQIEHESKRAKDLEKVTREIAALDITEREFRSRSERHILLGWEGCKNELQQGEVWRYEPEVVAAIAERIEEIRDLLRLGEVFAQPETLSPLLARRNALQNKSLQKMLCGLKS